MTSTTGVHCLTFLAAGGPLKASSAGSLQGPAPRGLRMAVFLCLLFNHLFISAVLSLCCCLRFSSGRGEREPPVAECERRLREGPIPPRLALRLSSRGRTSFAGSLGTWRFPGLGSNPCLLHGSSTGKPSRVFRGPSGCLYPYLFLRRTLVD